MTAVLAKMGLGDGVLGLIMPCHSNPTGEKHAREGEMGISYDELDSILVAIESGDTGECDQWTSARVRDMMAASQHKRNPIPICEF